MSSELSNLRTDPEAMDALQIEVVNRALNPAWEALTGVATGLERRGLDSGEALALVTSLFAEAADRLKTVQAGSALARGTQLKDLAVAWGYKTQSGITRYTPQIREAATYQAKADAEGKIVTVDRKAPDYGERPGYNFVWEMHPLHSGTNADEG